MSRRKPTKIEVTVEDKDELEDARRRSASTSLTATGAAFVLHHLDRNRDTYNHNHPHSPTAPPVPSKQRRLPPSP
ncbi:hypothetical protein ACHQM5_003838 [Ranunculus cassubicifolius]